MSDDCLALVSQLRPRGQANDDPSRVSPHVQVHAEGELQPSSSPLPNLPPRLQHQQQWPVLPTPGDDYSHDVDWTLRYERAAGVDVIARRVDALTHRLSRQHLRQDFQDFQDPSTLPIQVPSTSGSSPTPCSLPAELGFEVDPAFQDPIPSAETRARTTSSLSPAWAPSGLFREGDRYPAGQRPSTSRENTPLRKNPSTNFRDTIQNYRAMDKPNEVMNCTRAHGSVPKPLSVTPTDAEAHDINLMDVDSTCLDVDSNAGGLTECGILLEKLMEARRSSGHLGMRQHVYRSSTETALGCKNVVRNKPRMRKRTKLRDKPIQPAISAAAGLPATSIS